MTMTRQALTNYGQPLEELNEPVPVPQGSEVIVRIRNCGVCHSDLHLQDGYFSLGGDNKLDVRHGRELPFTLGHEIEGELVAAGPDADVGNLEIGKRYAVFPWIGCGNCVRCDGGEEHLCDRPRALGINLDGGFSTHLRVPDAKYLLNYDGISAEIACAYMCSGLTAYSALIKLGKRAERGPAVLVGLGGVGMMGLSLALAMHKHKPYVADIDPAKREAAMAAGAAAAFDPGEPGFRKTFMKATGGGVFGAVDFAGTDGSFAYASGAITKGGKVVVSGMIGGSFTMAVPMLPMRAIAIEGSFVGSLQEAKDMLDLVKQGNVAPIPVETRPLSAANSALNDLKSGKVVGRVVLEA